MLRNFVKTIKKYILDNKNGEAIFLYSLLSSALLYYCMELGNKNPLMNGFFYTFINILTVFVVQSAVYIIVRRRWIASIIVGVPFTVLSIANYYTLAFRNSPISTQDLHNFGTAMAVVDGYTFSLNIFVLGILIFTVLQIMVIIQLYKREKILKLSLRKAFVNNVCLIVCCSVFTHAVYFAQNPIKPRNTFVWSWEDSYYKYGYIASSIEVFQNSLNMIDKPKNYSESNLEKLDLDKITKTNAGSTPDVILILNETFYDMRDIVEVESDVPVMPFIDSLKTKGRMVIAGTGGGTNKSEYELLTSNSLQLMPAITPFNYLNFDSANSVVNYMEKLGYKTWGAHCAEAVNYARGIVYPKLGFDRVLFREEFGEVGKYDQRPYATDEFCYNKMVEDYETMGDGPRLQYILTIQNHGGWELNPKESDIVNCLTDFGDYTDDMSEYLSCIKKTDDAFKKLTEYYESIDRDVIVCMVGDHAPSFATELVKDFSLENTFALRSTPYVIWSNFDIDTKDIPATMSMPYLVPTVLDAAGVSLSPFYSQMLKLRKEVPALSAFGVYKTTKGETFKYSESTPYSNEINIYFNMVYNNVAEAATRIDSIFDPQRNN